MRCNRVSAPGPGTPRKVVTSFRPTAGHTRHPVPSVPRRGMRRLSASPEAGLPPPLPTRQAGGRPRTAGGPQGEAAPSIRGADSVLAGTALRTYRPKRGPAVFHCHALDVPGRSLGPALQAVDFDSVRRCGHGQLLHWLASIQLQPARMRRSRTLFRSILALKAQPARPGGEHPSQPRVTQRVDVLISIAVPHGMQVVSLPL